MFYEQKIFNEVETGKEIKIKFLHINNNTCKIFGMDFGQDIEPSGYYMTANDGKYKIDNERYIYGEITFKNPLVLEFINTTSNGWKKTLSDMFKGKKKKSLTNAIIKAGYDSIITIDSTDKEVKEIVSFL